MNTPRKPTVLAGKPAMDKLIDLYIDGFSTGASSMLATYAKDAPEEKRDALVDDFTAALRADPVMMHTVVQQINECLLGIDSGPKNLTSGFLGDRP